MPPKTPAETAEAAGEAAVRVAEATHKAIADAQKALADNAKQFEATLKQGVEQLRAQSRVYADAAGEHIDEAARAASDQIRARPLASTGAALGIGVLIGMLLASRR
jgi:ElaB/YqjD/DUF883 family membrane-anchored ribosome-binding protein